MSEQRPSNVLAIALERVAEYRKTRGQISMPYQAYMIALADEIEAARITAEYWKAEHLAGNAEVEQLKQDLRRAESARVAILAENTHYKRERDAYRALAGIGFSGTDEADELAKIEPAWERDAEAMRRRQERGLATMKAVADAVRAAQPPGDG